MRKINQTNRVLVVARVTKDLVLALDRKDRSEIRDSLPQKLPENGGPILCPLCTWGGG